MKKTHTPKETHMKTEKLSHPERILQPQRNANTPTEKPSLSKQSVCVVKTVFVRNGTHLCDNQEQEQEQEYIP